MLFFFSKFCPPIFLKIRFGFKILPNEIQLVQMPASYLDWESHYWIPYTFFCSLQNDFAVPKHDSDRPLFFKKKSYCHHSLKTALFALFNLCVGRKTEQSNYFLRSWCTAMLIRQKVVEDVDARWQHPHSRGGGIFVVSRLCWSHGQGPARLTLLEVGKALQGAPIT